MDLCQACQRINIRNLLSRHPSFPYSVLELRAYGLDVDGTGMWHLRNAQKLRQSATQCRLCNLIKEALERKNIKWGSVMNHPILLTGLLSYGNFPELHAKGGTEGGTKEEESGENKDKEENTENQEKVREAAREEAREEKPEEEPEEDKRKDNGVEGEEDKDDDEVEEEYDEDDDKDEEEDEDGEDDEYDDIEEDNKDNEEQAGRSGLRGIKVWMPMRVSYMGEEPEYNGDGCDLNLFAEAGSPAAVMGDIVCRPGLDNSGSPNAHSLVQIWIDACIRDHPDCKKSISGQDVNEPGDQPLPTRVIDVGPPDGSQYPRLVITNGASGHYVALSHCWGAKQQLITDSKNLEKRLEAIPWDIIPKTFQDAIDTTRALGIRYIWIDSLCILQDSIDDWSGEALRMGRVYEKARLTIAASHARDSSDGCFFEREAQPESIQIPFSNWYGKSEGTVTVSSQSLDETADGNEEQGTLARRAWITQEWLLSRRMIFYTKSCLIWSCKTARANEWTVKTKQSRAVSLVWKHIIEEHTARDLTYAKDRLISLEGLRVEMQSVGGDEYHFGHWKSEYPRNLYWWPKKKANREANPIIPKVPSWSWASSMAPISFNPPLQELTGRNGAFQTYLSFGGKVEVEDNTLVIKDCPLIKLPDHSWQASYNDASLIFDEDGKMGGPLHAFSILVSEGWADDRRYESYNAFLILKRDESQDAFLRVGRGHTENRDFFDGAVVQSFCIK